MIPIINFLKVLLIIKLEQPQLTQKILEIKGRGIFLEIREINLNFFHKGIQHRFNILRMPLLTSLFYRERHCRGCNVAYWHSDALAINGYDQRMKENGCEDTDFEERLMRSGIQQRHIKFAAVAFHVWHKTRSISPTNGALIDENRQKGTTRLEEGISNYLNTEP